MSGTTHEARHIEIAPGLPGRLDAWSRCMAPLGVLVTCAILCSFGGPAHAGDRIRATERITAGGAELFLETRGADRRKPLLLWLHGGPGGTERPLFRYYNRELENDFVVAYWDQRGAGRSFDSRENTEDLTIARHVADLDTVVDHLRERFHRDEVLLIGHSWGAALGLLYARGQPGKIAAVLGVAPVISTREGQEAEHTFVFDEALRRGDRKTQANLREIGSPPYDDAAETLAMERIAARYGAVFHNEPNRVGVLVRSVLSGAVTPCEIPRFIRANEASLEAMHGELLDLDLSESVPAVDVPVAFLLGRHDRHVDSRIAARYLETLQAPAKKLVWFESSAHNPPFEEPQRFNETVVAIASSL